MPYFACQVKNSPAVYVVEGENSTDALLEAYKQYAGHDRYEDQYEEEGNGNDFAESIRAECLDCTEIYRALVLEYVERRLDGDRNITILL